MKGFALRKGIAAILTIFTIVAANFVIFRIAPGDPVRMMFKDPRVKAEYIEKMRVKFGLDKPISTQFFLYLDGLAHADLGRSFWQKRPVADVIFERVPKTLLLVVPALLLAAFTGIFLGGFAGWKSGSKIDSVLLFSSLSMYSVPAFALAILLLLFFSYHLSIFPLGGIVSPASEFTGFAYILDLGWHLILPLCTVMVWYIGEFVVLTRNSMIEVMGQDYIITAKGKGLKEGTIFTKHALRNALLPVITVAGVNLGFAVAGIIEVETVFGWPGIGQLAYQAVLKRDYPLLQGLFLVFALSVILANLIIDLIYGYIDPRIKVRG